VIKLFAAFGTQWAAKAGAQDLRHLGRRGRLGLMRA